MGDYLFGEKLSTTYTQVVAIGGAADRNGIHSTTQKIIWTDDGEGGTNLFPFTAARDAMQFTGTQRLEFNDDAVYIHSRSDGVLTTSADVSTVIGTALFDLNASSGITIDGTTVSIDGTGASNFTATGGNLTLSTVTSGEIYITPVNFALMASGKQLQFGTSGDYISGTGSALSVVSGGDITLTATGDVNIPSGVGVTYGDDGEKIEGNGTDLTISASAKLNLTATSDIHIPKNVCLVFDDNASEKIESNNTDLTVNSGADINLTATTDINIPASVGLTFGSAANPKIEGDGTDLAIDVAGNLNVTSTVNEANAIYLRANAGTSETIKIHADQGTAVSESAPSLLLLSDAGGIGLRSTANLANAINLTVDGGSTSSMTLFNDQGTSVTEGSASIQLLTDAGGIGIKSSANLANAILLTADGGTSETIKLHADQGTGAASIELTSDAGGIGINTSATGKSLDINTAILDIDATEASNITMTANASSTTNLTIEATNSNGSYNSDIIVDADGVVHLRSNVTTNTYAGAGIQIGTDLSAVDISIGHTTSDVRIGDNLLVTGDATISTNLTVSGTATINTLAFTDLVVSDTTPTLTLTNTTEENSDLDGSSDTSAGRETRVIYKGEKADGTAHELATIVVGHQGTSDDLKGQIQFFTNSGTDSDGALTNVLNILDTGNIGIGTTSPSHKLEVTGDSGVNASIIVNSVASYDSTVYFAKAGTTKGVVGHDHGNDTVALVYDTAGASTKGINIDSAGNVGMGLVSPDSVLSVYSNITGKWAGVIDQDHTGGYGLSVSIDATDGNPILDLISVSDVVMRVEGNGNIGIGTTDPDVVIDVEATSAELYLKSFDTTNGNCSGFDFYKSGNATVGSHTVVADDECLGRIRFKGSDGSAYRNAAHITCLVDDSDVASDSMAGRLVFATSARDSVAPTNRMTIDKDGDVGIGTDSPESLCHIKNTADVLSASVHALQVEDSHATVDAGDVLVRLDYSGDADVHTALAKFISFHDSGGEIGYIATSSDGVISTSILSDVRLKTNIKDTSIEGLNVINALKIRDFKWGAKANANQKGKQVVGGWVADEVYEIYPQAVHGEPGQMMDVKDDKGNKTGEKAINPMGVSSGEFISVMMKAIQELSAKVESLEKAK